MPRDVVVGPAPVLLQQRKYLPHWTDNEPRIEWERIADGVAALHERVHDLYHSGIYRPKLA
jgi:Family of unknown function (DUF6421)